MSHLSQHRHPPSIVAGAEVFTVGENNSETKYAYLHLGAGIPQPFVGTEPCQRISNLGRIHKWSKLEVEQSPAINILVGLPIGQKIAASQRTAALPAIAGRNMTAQPQIIVWVQTKHKKLVEGNISKSFACAYLMLDFIVV